MNFNNENSPNQLNVSLSFNKLIKIKLNLNIIYYSEVLTQEKKKINIVFSLKMINQLNLIPI